jgi:HSP20 family molecular chaperone IbpA
MHPPALGQPPGASPDPFTRPQPAVEGRVLRPPQAHPHTGDRPPLSPQALARLGAQLDPTSRSLLAHLAEVSHAPIRELAAVIGAPSDMAVLFCIRHHINPAAQALLGRPVLFFVEAQLDRVTGQMVPFAWWLAGRRGRAPAPTPAPYELHDEGPTLTVLLELVGADPATIRCTAHGTRLAVTAAGPAQQWHNDIGLPAPVQSTAAGQRFNNGILSLQLVKTPAQED